MNQIALFDSGLGGINVVKYLREYLPCADLMFFGDYANCPYGDKTKSELEAIVKRNIQDIKNFSPSLLAIACNTAQANAYQIIKDSIDIPIYGLIEITCKQAVVASVNKRIGIIATQATINSQKYIQTLLNMDSHVEIFSLATPLLVTYIEQGKYSVDDKQTFQALNTYLNYFKDKNIDTLILACTHYDLLIESIKMIMPKVKIISSSKCLAKEIADSYQEKDNGKLGTLACYVSSDIAKFNKLASQILSIQVEAKPY